MDLKRSGSASPTSELTYLKRGAWLLQDSQGNMPGISRTCPGVEPSICGALLFCCGVVERLHCCLDLGGSGCQIRLVHRGNFRNTASGCRLRPAGLICAAREGAFKAVR